MGVLGEAQRWQVSSTGWPCTQSCNSGYGMLPQSFRKRKTQAYPIDLSLCPGGRTFSFCKGVCVCVCVILALVPNGVIRVQGSFTSSLREVSSLRGEKQVA